MAEFDFSEFDRLAADLDKVARSAKSNVRKAVEVTARKVKDAWRDKLKGSETLPALPYAVTYDIKGAQVFGTDFIEAEIGFDKSRPQGALGNVSEFGTPTVGARGYGLASLEENQADFVEGLRIAADETLNDAGL